MHCISICSFVIFAFLFSPRNEKPIIENAKRFNTLYSLKGNPSVWFRFNTLEGFSNRETT